MTTEKLPKDYPILGKIVDDIKLEEDGRCAMAEMRLKFWETILRRKFPRGKHLELYRMIGGMSLEFSKKKAMGAVQLFYLACIGLDELEARKLADGNDFLKTKKAQAAFSKLNSSTGSRVAGLAPPSGGIGMKIGKR